MNIITVQYSAHAEGDAKLQQAQTRFSSLIEVLQQRKLPDEIIVTINSEIELIHSSPLAGKALGKAIAASQRKILLLLEKKLSVVPQNHYRNMWMMVGMSAFGLPFGVAFGMLLDNIGLMGIGLPIGMAIGIGVGTNMDKKAAEQGLQLAWGE